MVASAAGLGVVLAPSLHKLGFVPPLAVAVAVGLSVLARPRQYARAATFALALFYRHTGPVVTTILFTGSLSAVVLALVAAVSSTGLLRSAQGDGFDLIFQPLSLTVWMLPTAVQIVVAILIATTPAVVSVRTRLLLATLAAYGGALLVISAAIISPYLVELIIAHIVRSDPAAPPLLEPVP